MHGRTTRSILGGVVCVCLKHAETAMPKRGLKELALMFGDQLARVDFSVINTGISHWQRCLFHETDGCHLGQEQRIDLAKQRREHGRFSSRLAYKGISGMSKRTHLVITRSRSSMDRASVS